METQTHNDLLQAALRTAEDAGLTVKTVPRAAEPRPKGGLATDDGVLRLGRGAAQQDYVIELRRGLRPATLGAALHRIERFGRPGLLIADHITPPMAQRLREQGVPFLDAAGNAYLEQPGLLVWVVGNKPAAPAVPPALGRAFQPTGLQLVFALLCDPDAVNRPYRELAAMAGVAHGTVGWVMPELQREGFLADLDGRRGTRRLFKRDRLITQWADAYARVLRPRLLLGTWYLANDTAWKDWPVQQFNALWGGEAAGALLTDNLRPGELTLYADKLPALLAAKQRFLANPEPGHTLRIEVRRKFWQFALPDLRADVTPPLLAYADLLATDDARCIETARAIHDAYVDRPLAQT